MAKKKLEIKGRKNIYPDDVDSILQEVGELFGHNYLFTLTCLDINQASRYYGRYAFATNISLAEESLKIVVKLTKVQIQKIAKRWNVDVEDLLGFKTVNGKEEEVNGKDDSGVAPTR